VGINGYEIYRDGNKVGTSTATRFTDSALKPSTTYRYAVKAYDAANNSSAASSPLPVKTGERDKEAPTVPTDLNVTDITASSVSLVWTASTDNYRVAGYEVYRDGAKVGTGTTNSYTDTNLSPSTAYTYSVRAYDAANNASAPSSALSVTTRSGNTATVYYKQGFAPDVCLHYRPQGGSWTGLPGEKMAAAEVAGYTKLMVNLGAATQLEVAFNNCHGQWDSNNANNYFFPVGTSTYDASRAPKITSGAPQAPELVGVTFTVSATTAGNQNVYVIGDSAELGGWDTSKAKPLNANPSPTWTTTLTLPANTTIQYKYIKKEGNVVWEGGGNRRFTTPASGSVSRDDSWQP
jgi:chitodextrinase